MKKLLRPVIDALKLYGLPFLLIQSCAIALVVAYYQYPPIQGILGHIAQWKAGGGLLFSAISAAIAGGILPEIAKSLTGKAQRPWNKARISDTLYNVTLFITLGIIADLFYRFQGLMFGYDLAFKTVILKLLVDHLLWSPFIGQPYIILFYLWRENRFQWRPTLKSFSIPFYINRVAPLQVPAWFYWIPVTACMYALPADLQIPLWLFALAAWSLILVFIAKTESKEEVREASTPSASD